jgi:hypothetical protein
MTDTTEAKPQKTGGKKYSTLLECVQALKEMGALSVSVSNDKIEATFPQQQSSFHVEQKPEFKEVETLLGYPKDVLLHST